MPIHVRTRLATVALIGVFLIPLTQSTLRGVDHILTCTEQVETPFQVSLDEGDAIVTGSKELEPGDPETLCGGLAVEISAGPSEERDVTVFVYLDNTTDVDWYGTVDLEVGSVRIPVDLGRVQADDDVTRSIELKLPPGITGFDGALLIGP